MKKVIWLVFWGVVLFVPSVYAQSKVAEQLESEYMKGNRDRNFLKEYIATLKIGGQTERLNDVVDEYLMMLPLNERYAGENFAAFMECVIHLDTRTFVDIIENWDKLSLGKEQVDNVVKKMDNMCKIDMFNAIVGKKNDGTGKVKDYGIIQTVLKKSQIPFSNTRCQVIDMWQCWRNSDLTGMMQALERMITNLNSFQEEGKNRTSLDLDAMFEGVVIGSMLNYILEECNQQQCVQMLKIMNQAIDENGREGFMETIIKKRDDFEGKKMMMEMGEE